MSRKIHKYVVCIAGPTAVGKTATAVRLAQHFDTDIISADSRQIYREMRIGTARPTADELYNVKCRFTSYVNIGTPYSAGDFERDALNAISKIHQTKDIVIVAGGTGLYHKALLEGFDELPNVPASVRDKRNKIFESDGLVAIQNELKAKDPDYYDNVDINNHVRLIRALCVIDVSGKPFSHFHNRQPKQRPFKAIRIFLNMDRQVLYERIDTRVDQMIEEGLVKEARELIPYRNEQALQTVGYRELFPYFDGECTLDEAIDKIKQHSRNYAKRQVTWYRNQGNWTEVEASNFNDVLQNITSEFDL